MGLKTSKGLRKYARARCGLGTSISIPYIKPIFQSPRKGKLDHQTAKSAPTSSVVSRIPVGKVTTSDVLDPSCQIMLLFWYYKSNERVR